MSKGEDGNVLSFDTAMAQFSAMFPQMSARLIESVLRRHDGNVARTIEELLERSESGNTECPSSSSCSARSDQCWAGARQKETVKEELDKQQQKMVRDDGHQQQRMDRSAPNGTIGRRDPCAEDEKIALLIQNREFLRYLRHDPHFQQAMIGQHQASARHAHRQLLPAGPAVPRLLTASRSTRSPNTSQLFHRQRTTADERPPPVPDGPLVEFGSSSVQQQQELAIPQGPLIDYSHADSAGWAGRLKAKLGKRPPEGSEPLPASPLVHLSDEQMRQGVQGLLARGGKGLLQGLASRFSGGVQRQRLRSTEDNRPDD